MPNDSPADQIPWDHLARFFAGELPPAEAERLRHWIAAAPERADQVQRLREVWEQAAGLRQSWDTEAALTRIKRVPAGPVRVTPIPKFYREEPGTPLRRAARVLSRVAAAAIVVAGAAGIWSLSDRRPEGEPAAPASVVEMATPRGQRATLRLPDGTRVMLGPASTLRYASTYSVGPRDVHLEGEAYFDVVHDSTKPFTVRTAHGVATDLGTRFDVRSYAGDSALRVAVTHGLVSLAGARDRLLLAAGDLGRLAADGSLHVQRGIDLREYLAWTEGRVVFQDTPLRDAAAQLGRWYDLDVRLATPAIGGRRLTATFTTEPASEVMRLVAASLGLWLEQRGRVVTLRPRS